MKKEIADKWVAALRSGKYKQGKTQLRTKNNEFCCLGVLCDISKLTEWTKRAHTSISYDGCSGGLAPSVMIWSGVKDSMGRLDKSIALYQLNDTRHIDAAGDEVTESLTFDEIADVIQMTYKEL